MFKPQSYQDYTITTCIVLLALTASLASSESFKSPCGSAYGIAKRVGGCLQPIFDLVEGKVADPKGDQDLVAVCNRFADTEKCIRVIAKDCLVGVHKTAVGTVATATKRFRVQECKTIESRAKYAEVLRCAKRRANDMAAMYKNQTAIEQAIVRMAIPPEEKLIKSCCVLQQMDREITRIFNRDCPASTPLVLGIVKAMTEDARNTLCHNPKCKGVLDVAMRTAQYKPPQNFIEPIMEVLFELNTD